MHARARTFRQVATTALGLAALAAAAQGPGDWHNATAGGRLRAGVYGRIEVRAGAEPPPVIYPQPVVAHSGIDRVRSQPVYLYVPPGQVRKWKDHCAKWAACEQPVLFVRMDRSPSQWGQWRQRREALAWEREAHPVAP